MKFQIRWPWRYALVRVKLLDDGCYDYEVRVDAGPTRWGPWVLPISVEEVERTRFIGQRLVAHLRTQVGADWDTQAIVRLRPGKGDIDGIL